jgi:hypothetical protein
MIKLQYLVRPRPGVPRAAFAEQLLGELAAALLEQDPAGLKITLSLPEPPRLSVIPFVRRQVALVSVWTGEEPRISEVMRSAAGELSGWRVEESTPLAYARDWPDGRRTPGVCLLTLLNRKRGLDADTFMHRWHGVHTPLSLRIHPLWCYIRNVVREPVVAGSPRIDGIVEEHFRQREDLLDPRRFFGGSLLWMLPNMARVALDISGFLDLRSLEAYLAHEHHLR